MTSDFQVRRWTTPILDQEELQSLLGTIEVALFRVERPQDLVVDDSPIEAFHEIREELFAADTVVERRRFGIVHSFRVTRRVARRLNPYLVFGRDPTDSSARPW